MQRNHGSQRKLAVREIAAVQSETTCDESSQTEPNTAKSGFSFMTKLMLNHMKGAAAATAAATRRETEATNDGSTDALPEKVAASQDNSLAEPTDMECRSNQSKPIGDIASSALAAQKKTEFTNEFAMLSIYPIGTLHSIYSLCVCTPRQVSSFAYA